jgi:flagellar biosynthesis protein FlhB
VAEENREDRTEAATPRRIQQALEEGRIAISRESAQWLALAAGLLVLVATARPLRDALVALVGAGARGLVEPHAPALLVASRPVLLWGGVVVATTALVGALALAVQTGLRIWPENLFRGFEQMLDGSRLKRLFSREMAVDVLIQLVKVVCVGWVAWLGTRDEILTLPTLLQARADAQVTMLFAPLMDGGVKVVAILGVFAGLDFALQRYRHNQSLKMTKEELKRDMREEDGDPLIKGRRRRRYRDLLKNRAALEVPRADALVVNPTHIAIAIRYRAGQDRAPLVTAKGKGMLAEHMRDLARRHGVPIVEDVPLARLLYKKVKPGRTVPVETYKAVAAILAWVYRITGRAPSPARQIRPAVNAPARRPELGAAS